MHVVSLSLYLQSLHWRHNEHDGVSNHQPHGRLLNRLFRHRSKQTSKLCVTGRCEGTSPVTGQFPAQRSSNVDSVSIWWRHKVKRIHRICLPIFLRNVLLAHGQYLQSKYHPSASKVTLEGMRSIINWTLQWRHNGRDGVSNHQPRDCLFNRLYRRRSRKTSKLRVTGLCEGNSPVTGEFPAQMASSAENVSIWWRHHGPNNYEAQNKVRSACIILGMYSYLIHSKSQHG